MEIVTTNTEKITKTYSKSTESVILICIVVYIIVVNNINKQIS